MASAILGEQALSTDSGSQRCQHFLQCPYRTAHGIKEDSRERYKRMVAGGGVVSRGFILPYCGCPKGIKERVIYETLILNRTYASQSVKCRLIGS